MSIRKLEKNLDYISNLPDKPAIQPSQLKEKFDAAGKDIKEYINETLISDIEEEIGNSGTTVENSLTSDSTTNALSAKQGKELNNSKQKKILFGTEAPTGGENGDIYLQYID